jgi:hydroxymethylglutaryl-CoA synthase
MHGCYGATAALLSVADWVAAPGWDGRLGVVVATDIAVYPPGSPARPTGGCGAAALLVGPDAPLVLERAPWRSHFAAHTFDFFKPHGHPLYPVVDGPQTLLWFTRAADACAARLHDQLHAAGQLPTASAAGAGSGAAPTQQQQQDEGQQQQQQQQPSDQQAAAVGGLLSCVDFFISHAPYNKLVRKVFARLVMQDCLR